MLRNPFRWFLGLESSSGSRRGPLSFRLNLDALEERLVPSVYHVTNSDDAGAGSLRDAVDMANAHPGTDKIIFDGSLSGQTITLSSGELHITDDLNVHGLGADKLTISGNDTSRVFEFDPGTTSKITGLTITGGDGVADPNEFGDFDSLGGGILNFGTLTVKNCVVSNNTAGHDSRTGSGGGIANEGTLTLGDSTLSGNGSSSGGGIHNDFSATLTLHGCHLSGNGALSGGGIINFATADVTDCIVSGNSARTGGGIVSVGDLTIRGSTLSDNSASNAGALVIGFSSTATISDCVVRDNSAEVNAGAIDNVGMLTVRHSVFVHNSAMGLRGGAIWNDPSGTLDVSDSSFTDNFSQTIGGAIANQGSTTLRDTTVSGNSAIFAGGGISNEGVGLTVSHYSTIVGNLAPTGADVWDPAGTLTKDDSSTIGVFEP